MIINKHRKLSFFSQFQNINNYLRTKSQPLVQFFYTQITTYKLLFWSFLLFYIILGLSISYANDSIITQNDIIFDADTESVYNSFIVLKENIRSEWHPFTLKYYQ